MGESATRRRLLTAILAAGSAVACGPSQEEWQAKLNEVTELEARLQQRDWQVQTDQQRINGLIVEQDRLQRALAELQTRYDTETTQLQTTVGQLQAIVAEARRQSAEQAMYPTALLDGSPLPENVEPRDVGTPPITLRRLELSWHFRSSHGGEANVSFSASVRRDLSEYCSLCTVYVRAACSDDEMTLTDVRAITEAENIVDMGAGDTAEMSCAIFRNAPLQAEPSRCELTVSLAESSEEGGGVLLGRYCWRDARVRDGRCPAR
jgi:hypothetical protein